MIGIELFGAADRKIEKPAQAQALRRLFYCFVRELPYSAVCAIKEWLKI